MTESIYMDDDRLTEVLAGRRVVKAEDTVLTLDNGVELEIESYAYDCCSYVELTSLAATDHIITAARFADNEEETGGEGDYRAWIEVITEAGVVNIAEADGDASNGYYIHGFALEVYVRRAA